MLYKYYISCHDKQTIVYIPGLLNPHTVVIDVEVVHDIVWLSRIENTSHRQQTLEQLSST